MRPVHIASPLVARGQTVQERFGRFAEEIRDRRYFADHDEKLEALCKQDRSVRRGLLARIRGLMSVFSRTNLFEYRNVDKLFLRIVEDFNRHANSNRHKYEKLGSEPVLNHPALKTLILMARPRQLQVMDRALAASPFMVSDELADAVETRLRDLRDEFDQAILRRR